MVKSTFMVALTMLALHEEPEAKEKRAPVQVSSPGSQFTVVIGPDEKLPENTVREIVRLSRTGFSSGKHDVLLSDEQLRQLLVNPGVRSEPGSAHLDPTGDKCNLQLIVRIVSNDKSEGSSSEISLKMVLQAIKKLEKLSDSGRTTRVIVSP